MKLGSKGIAKTSAIVLVVLITFSVAIGAWAVTRPPPPERKIATITSIGGRGDLSFNDMSVRGTELASAAFGIPWTAVEPKIIPDFLPLGRELAADPAVEFITFTGFLSTSALATVAMENPDKNFIGIDTHAQRWIRDNPDPAIAARYPLPNLLDIRFAQHQGSALAGALAGLIAANYGYPHVGVVFGMDIPVLWNFEAGYKWGVDYAMSWIEMNRPDMMRGIYHTPRRERVLWAYATCFRSPHLGHAAAKAMYGEGAGVVYNVAGGTGIGIKDALADLAEEKGITIGPPFWVGVDANQDWMLPGLTVTSMMKRVDIAVFNAVRLHMEGRFREAVENHRGEVVVGLGTYILDILVEAIGLSGLGELDEFIEFGKAAEIIRGVPVLPMPPPAIRARVQEMRAKVPEWIWDMVEDFEEKIRAGIIEIPDIWTKPGIDHWRAILG